MQKFSMLGHRDKVAVGVSGGKDSLALLYVLKRFFEEHNRTTLVAITIDEGINSYRDESLQIVKDFCSRIKVETKVSSYNDLFGLDMDQAMLQRPKARSRPAGVFSRWLPCGVANGRS